jgi:hypothetical protein
MSIHWKIILKLILVKHGRMDSNSSNMYIFLLLLLLLLLYINICIAGWLQMMLSDYIDLLVRIAHIICNHPLYMRRGSSVGIALEYRLDSRGSRFDFRMGLGIFLFTTASRTALEPIQPPIQWVPAAPFLGVKRPGREADHSLPSSAEVSEWVALCPHSPNTSSWRGA